MKLAELQRLGGRPLCESNFEVLAQIAASGRGLNAPNDVVVAPNGDVYFSDPVYGFLKKQPPELGYTWLNAERGEPTDQPYLDEAVAAVGAGVTGVYRWRAGGGALELVTDLLNRPNARRPDALGLQLGQGRPVVERFPPLIPFCRPGGLPPHSQPRALHRCFFRGRTARGDFCR